MFDQPVDELVGFRLPWRGLARCRVKLVEEEGKGLFTLESLSREQVARPDRELEHGKGITQL